MILSFRTDWSGQIVQTQIRSSLFAILSASFGCIILWLNLFFPVLGCLQQSLLVSENLGSLRYSLESPLQNDSNEYLQHF